jgi:hypothetical protein
MQLSLQGLHLTQLQGTFGKVWLQLTNLVNLQVALERLEKTLYIKDLSAQRGELQLKIPMTEGEVSFSSPLQVEGILADLQDSDGKPVIGTASLTALKIPGVLAQLPQLTLSAVVSASIVLFERLPVGDTLLFCKTLTLQNISAKNALLEASIASITLHEVKLSLGQDSFQLTCSAIQLEKVSARTQELSLSAEAIHLTEGVSLSKREVSLGQIESEALIVSALFSGDKQEPTEKKPGPKLDLRILDGIEGKLAADIDVKVRVPILGHRHAVHKIRMPIEEGAINFHALKNDLSFLEGSLLDFAVEGEQLILLLDLPIVSDRPLVFWALDHAGQQLAGRDRVLLRTLTSARPAKTTDENEPKKESPLVHLSVDNLDLDIVLFSQEAFTLDGIIPKLSIGQLAVKGHLRHLPVQETQPTSVEILAKKIALSLYQLAVGARFLSIRSIDIGAVQNTTLLMKGLQPASLQLTLSQLKLRGVSL